MQNAASMELSRISDDLKLIIFDLDGTLIDSSKPMQETLNYTLKKFGRPELAQDNADATIGIPLSQLFMKLLDRPSRDSVIEEAISIYREKYIEICLEDSFLYDGVADTIPILAEKFQIAMATTKKTNVAQMTLDHFKLLKYFKTVLGFDKVSEAKPSPEIILKILDELKVLPEYALMVGDSLYDLNAGKAAGVPTCVVTYGFEKQDVLQENDPDYIIDQFDELTQLL